MQLWVDGEAASKNELHQVRLEPMRDRVDTKRIIVFRTGGKADRHLTTRVESLSGPYACYVESSFLVAGAAVKNDRMSFFCPGSMIFGLTSLVFFGEGAV
jgi:hypothetical protein